MTKYLLLVAILSSACLQDFKDDVNQAKEECLQIKDDLKDEIADLKQECLELKEDLTDQINQCYDEFENAISTLWHDAEIYFFTKAECTPDETKLFGWDCSKSPVCEEFICD